MTLFDLAFIFLGIGLTEAVVKPIAKRWVQSRILRAIDAQLPELLTLPSGPENNLSIQSYSVILGES